MGLAIRIIHSPRPAEANLQAVEREEQILAVARLVAEASGELEQSKIDACAARLRAVTLSSTDNSMKQLAYSITSRLTDAMKVPVFLNNSDIDIKRIMKLLEG
jgi:hypothetical protein